MTISTRLNAVPKSQKCAKAVTLNTISNFAHVRAREQLCARGVVSSVTRSTPLEPPRLEIAVSDGHTELHAVFMGRRDVPGLTVGRPVTLCGRFTTVDGDLVTLNPEYELLTHVAAETS